MAPVKKPCYMCSVVDADKVPFNERRFSLCLLCAAKIKRLAERLLEYKLDGDIVALGTTKAIFDSMTEEEHKTMKARLRKRFNSGAPLTALGHYAIAQYKTTKAANGHKQ